MSRHRRKAGMPMIPCTFIAVAQTKLFRNKFVNPWAYVKILKKDAMLMMPSSFIAVAQALGPMGRSLD